MDDKEKVIKSLTVSPTQLNTRIFEDIENLQLIGYIFFTFFF